MNLPKAVENFISHLSELPSLGPRQATRLAFYLLRLGQNSISELANAVRNMQDVKTCEQCFFAHQNVGALCDICKDKRRNQKVIMVVEKETDLISLENTGKFIGRYLVLGEIPKTGVLEDWQKLRLQSMKSMIKKDQAVSGGPDTGCAIDEIILAFNPTASGDFNASLVAKELAPFAKKISRLGKGLPTGGEIEFADDETLGSALERRL